MEKRYQVFVSSTFIDLELARGKAAWALQVMGCIPSGMELFPASSDNPWTVIQRVLDDCDYYILILGGRYGSLDEDGIGFTEKEYDYATKAGKPVLSFLYDNPETLPGDKLERADKGRRKFAKFRQKAHKGRTVAKWSTPDELAAKITTSLHQEIKKGEAEGWVKGRFAAKLESTSKLYDRIDELERKLAEATKMQQATKNTNTIVINFESWSLINVGQQQALGYLTSVSPENAWYVQYYFTVSFFNTTTQAIGLLAIKVEFWEDGTIAYTDKTPAETNTSIYGQDADPRDLRTITLPPGQWVTKTVRGFVRNENMKIVRSCKEAYFTAATTSGEDIKKVITKSINESSFYEDTNKTVS